VAAASGCESSHPGSTPARACTTPAAENEDPSSVFVDGGTVRPINDDDVAGEAVANEFGVGETDLHGFDELAVTSPSSAAALDVALGTNPRTCETCHSISSGWTARPSDLTTLFGASNSGGDATASAANAIFLPVDGSTSPNADLSTPASRQSAFSLLLARGVIRVGEPVPNDAEFSLTAVDDPYGFATSQELSLFRRVPEMANLRFLTDVMWDARETRECQPLEAMLEHQANDAAQTHGQASASLPETQLQDIAAHERVVYFAQEQDNNAGDLDVDGALGGPLNLVSLPFYPGINAFPGPDPKGVAFNAQAFTLFAAWASSPTSTSQGAARAAIARGEALFNVRSFTITNVSGLNDDLGQSAITGTCTTCHNTPNVGNNSLEMRFDTGISDAARRSPSVPLYTFTNSATGDTVQTMDPGRALITGQWKDLQRFKVPSLRGLANRAPYFHDGSAPALLDVVNFDDTRFSIGLSDSEKSDLVAFLSAL
jgi:hypothetical protein